MKIMKKIIAFFLIILNLASLAACGNSLGELKTQAPDTTSVQSSGLIYLFGEVHGAEKVLDKEFALWYDYYHNEGMRHLFIEYSYFTAEFLNVWILSDSDDILEAVYQDWAGTASHVPYIKEFYKKIKSQCPETIFHGTDVGHQYDTTGKRFLKYLEENGMEDTDQYLLVQKAIEQGKFYYSRKSRSDVYRENTMTENFIREFDKLNGESIMGIYGAAHTGLHTMAYNAPSVPCMANQLKERYGDTVCSEDLSWLSLEMDPLRVDTIKVNEKDYDASYFGRQDLTGFRDNAYREFWRLENAYDDFKDRPKTGRVLPYDNYLMLIETGQVFVLDYIKKDGSAVRMYFRSDGHVWDDLPATEEFTIE